MRSKIYFVALCCLVSCLWGCKSEKKEKDTAQKELINPSPSTLQNDSIVHYLNAKDGDEQTKEKSGEGTETSIDAQAGATHLSSHHVSTSRGTKGKNTPSTKGKRRGTVGNSKPTPPPPPPPPIAIDDVEEGDIIEPAETTQTPPPPPIETAKISGEEEEVLVETPIEQTEEIIEVIPEQSDTKLITEVEKDDSLQDTTTKIVGVLTDAVTHKPIAGVEVLLLNQNIATKTDANGQFSLQMVNPANEEISFSHDSYLPKITTINISSNQLNNLGEVVLIADIQSDVRQDAIMQLSDNNFSDDEGRATQAISGNLAKGDVYISQTSYSFSPMRFRLRGYDNEFSSTYINGVNFNTSDRGGFSYSSLGGMNDAMRNKDIIYGLEANSFSFGNLGNNTNIATRATAYARGTKASVALSNRSYTYRAQVRHSTGLLPSGWAFTLSGIIRYSKEGIVDGSFYNSSGYFFSAEKVFNSHHSLSLVTWGAPTQRTSQSALTQEVVDLAGSIYYNPNWGYQEGYKRNARVVKTYDPTIILSHIFKINDRSQLRTGIGYHYSNYSNSNVGFYNSIDPRPNYYRYLPSYQSNELMKNDLTKLWQIKADEDNPEAISQLNWNRLYAANYRNNEVNPDGTAKYILERKHYDLMETSFSSVYSNQLTNRLKLTAGIETKYAIDMNYKTIDDLLGGKQWIDIDQFAERDFKNNSDIIQNDLNNPNRVVGVGDKFGYDYDVNITQASAFIQNEWNWAKLDLYYAGKISYKSFYREGFMKNGRAPKNSYGKAKAWWFADPALKMGATYKVNGRNRVSANVVGETRSPLPNDAYVSERTKDTPIPNLESRQVLSGDMSYSFLYPGIKGKIGVFHTEILNATDDLGYYDDEQRTFINHILTKSNKRYQGVEAGVTVKINRSFSISAAGTYADYRYTNNSTGIKSFENGSQDDITEEVLTKDLKINAGPQLAANFTIDYFHPKMWFADITLNYFDNNYLDFAPNRFTKSNMAKYTTPEAMTALGVQEKLKGGFLLDASVGKVIYLPDRKSINLNLSVNNILNNTSLVTGGYQQARLPIQRGSLDMNNLSKFPNKYYFAWGMNFFLNVGVKF